MNFSGMDNDQVFYIYRCAKTNNLIRPINDWHKKLSSEDHDAYPYCDCPKRKCNELNRQMEACSKWNQRQA